MRPFAKTDSGTALARRRRRFRHRLSRVRPRPDVADDRQHGRRHVGRHRRGHERRARGPAEWRRPGRASTRASTRYGIRTAPYHELSAHLRGFSGTEVHLDGEIYGAIGWQARRAFHHAGFTTDELLDYLVDGMNYTPANPKFEQMRDGILQAAPPGVDCLIWRGFARYGVGVGASATFRGTKSRSRSRLTFRLGARRLELQA